MADAVHVTVTFTRSLLVNGFPRNFTASLTFLFDEYSKMSAEEIEALKLEKVERYVAAEEAKKPTSEDKEAEVARINRTIEELQELKERAGTADQEIAKLTAIASDL